MPIIKPIRPRTRLKMHSKSWENIAGQATFNYWIYNAKIHLLLFYSVIKIIWVLLIIPFSVLANDVAKYCSPTGLNVLELNYRDTNGNIQLIQRSSIGSSEVARRLNRFYKDLSKNSDNKDFSVFIEKTNTETLLDSADKSLFLKYTTTESRFADPTTYRNAVLKALNRLVPKELNMLDWFLNLKDMRISETSINPANKEDELNIAGARTNLTPVKQSKFKLEILFSNHESLSFPYLLTLLAHELQHGFDYLNQLSSFSNEIEGTKLRFIDEGPAFDVQMKTYIALIKKHPQLFCNWIQTSWSYGDLPVPLSWSMATMERDLASGVYLDRYVEMPDFKEYPFLRNSSGKGISLEIKKRIKKLRLKYVK